MKAGYSGTPLPKKLGIKDGHAVLFAGAPAEFDQHLIPLPHDVRVLRVGRMVPGGDPEGMESVLNPIDLPDRRFDVALLFCPRAADLERLFRPAISCIKWNGGLWVCWPKKSSPLHVDLAESQVRSSGLEAGLVDNKICAVTQDWSGLRFVVRREDRPKGDEEGGPTA